MKEEKQLPKALQNAKPSKWLEEAKWRIENEDWLDLSFEIALRVYTKLKEEGKTQAWLAEQMGCSAQYVGRLLKGQENLTLQTITKLESVMGINLIALASPTQMISWELDVKPNVPTIGELTRDSSGVEALEENIAEYETFTRVA